MSQSATRATQNDMTTCLETFEKGMFCSFPHRHRHATGKPETRDETRGRSKKSISWQTRLSNWLECPQSATRATQNDMTTCLENLRKGEVCSFPYRHGDATGKPETRDETRGRSKTRISCETSSNYDTFDTLSNGWNVTKCHACHAKRNDNLLGNLRKGEVLQLPP